MARITYRDAFGKCMSILDKLTIGRDECHSDHDDFLLVGVFVCDAGCRC